MDPAMISKNPSLGYLKGIAKKKSLIFLPGKKSSSTAKKVNDRPTIADPPLFQHTLTNHHSAIHSISPTLHLSTAKEYGNHDLPVPVRRSVSLQTPSSSAAAQQAQPQHHQDSHRKLISTSYHDTPLLLHEKYDYLTNVKKIGKGATATIYVMTDHHHSSAFSAITSPSFFRKKSFPFIRPHHQHHPNGSQEQGHSDHFLSGTAMTHITKMNKGLDVGVVLALKRFHRHQPASESKANFDQRLRKEFLINKAARHQHIVTVFDMLKDRRGRWCIVMEFCQGGDVLSILQELDLTNDAMDCMFKQLLLGLAHLHDSGVAHRDIKPDNLLMTREGILKITDFGVAQQRFDQENEDKVMCQGLCGSIPYWPPELFTTLEYDGLAMDIWSAAITFYCLLYRQIPFLQATMQDRHYATFLRQVSASTSHWCALSRCEPDIQECLLSMMDPCPSRRWSIHKCLGCSWMRSTKVCYHHSSTLRHCHHFM